MWDKYFEICCIALYKIIFFTVIINLYVVTLASWWRFTFLIKIWTCPTYIVYPWVSIAIEAISNCCSKNLRYYRDYEQNKTNATSHHLFFCKLIIVFTLSTLCVTCLLTCMGNPKTSLEKWVEIASEGEIKLLFIHDALKRFS